MAGEQYAEWVKNVPQEIKNDALWSIKAYRFSMYISDLAWDDARKLQKHPYMLGLINQLYRAVGSIGANIAEGYSRASGRERAKFYEYALGSAREARDWYYKGRHVLGNATFEHRMRILNEIIRLLITMISQQRGYREIREEHTNYE